jgi:Tti2 family
MSNRSSSLTHTHLSTCLLAVSYQRLQAVRWALKITTRGKYGRDILEHLISFLGVCVISRQAGAVWILSVKSYYFDQALAYEGLWHLIIPPVMTLLDDYEAPYKIHGIKIVSELFHRVPIDLLKRTGIDGLLFTVCLTPFSSHHSLHTTHTSPSSPQSPYPRP